jgi:hypothetical protein
VRTQAELAESPVPEGRTTANRPARIAPGASRDIALIDLLDRLLGGGVVLTGDITLAVADIDLVQVALRALISSVSGLGGEEPRHGKVGAT